jgi:hypothetical protein
MNRLRRNLVVIALVGASARVFAVGVGGVAPSFTLPTAAGQSVALEAFRGNVVYVDSGLPGAPPALGVR